ncbi:MAG: non-hydrolyzing UDP-N-acetylglucosamine 2-epimerase [Burkholderiaceae bacterium]
MSGIDDDTTNEHRTATARTILCVVGARPNYMKMAPIIRALEQHGDVLRAVLVHTGQHYDAAMNDSFFTALGMPRPAVNLEVGSASHAQQTAEIMKRFEPVLDAHQPVAVLVVGDVNSTIACALVASKKGVPVVHVEAGLRSYDRTMPEEINRVLTDQIADLLYITERSALADLNAEGIAGERIVFVGNVMIDTLLANRAAAVSARETLRDLPVAEAAFDNHEGYGVVTLHRPSNVDDRDTFARLVGALNEVAARLPLVLALHPRTQARIAEFGFADRFDPRRLAILPPQGYLEMLGLMADATMVLTDSGGLQEETTALGVPCLTLRENTERPITISEGTNTLCGTDARCIVDTAFEILDGGGKRGRVPELWDGHAAERIASHLVSWFAARGAAPAGSHDADAPSRASNSLKKAA